MGSGQSRTDKDRNSPGSSNSTKRDGEDKTWRNIMPHSPSGNGNVTYERPGTIHQTNPRSTKPGHLVPPLAKPPQRGNSSPSLQVRPYPPSSPSRTSSSEGTTGSILRRHSNIVLSSSMMEEDTQLGTTHGSSLVSLPLCGVEAHNPPREPHPPSPPSRTSLDRPSRMDGMYSFPMSSTQDLRSDLDDDEDEYVFERFPRNRGRPRNRSPANAQAPREGVDITRRNSLKELTKGANHRGCRNGSRGCKAACSLTSNGKRLHSASSGSIDAKLMQESESLAKARKLVLEATSILKSLSPLTSKKAMKEPIAKLVEAAGMESPLDVSPRSPSSPMSEKSYLSTDTFNHYRTSEDGRQENKPLVRHGSHSSMASSVYSAGERQLRQLISASNFELTGSHPRMPPRRVLRTSVSSRPSASVDYKALYHASQSLINCNTLDALNGELICQLSTLCDFESCRLLTIEDDVAIDLFSKERLSIRGLVGYAWTLGTVLCLEAPFRHPHFDLEEDKYDGPQIYLPVQIDGKNEALLLLARSEDNHFDPHEEEILKAFASVLGGCLGRLRLQGVTNIGQMRSAVMARVAYEVSQPDDDDHSKILRHILEVALHLTDATHGAFFTARSGKKCFEIYGLTIEGTKIVTKARSHAGSIPGHVASTIKMLNLVDATECEYFNLDIDTIVCLSPKTTLALPVTYKGNLVAILQLWNKTLEGRKVYEFSGEDVATVQELADYIAAALCQGEALRRAKEEEVKWQSLLKGACELADKGLKEGEIMHAMITQGQNLLGSDSCSIRLFDKHMETRAQEGECGGQAERHIEAEAIRTQRPILITDFAKLREDDRESSRIELKSRSLLAMPIVSDEVVIGIATFRSKKPNRFADEDQEVCSRFLTYACLALRNAYLFQCTEQEKQKNRGMLEIAQELQRHQLDEHALAAVVMRKCKDLTNADRSSLFVVDANKATITAYLEDGGTITLPMNVGLAGHVARTGEILNLSDAHTDSRFNKQVDMQTGYTTKSVLCMPVICEGRIWAVAQVLNKKDMAGEVVDFTQQDISVISAFAVYAGLCLRTSSLDSYRQQLHQRNELLLKVTKLLSNANLVEDDIIDCVIEGTSQLVKADRCSLFMVDDDTETLEAYFADGIKVKMPKATGIAGHVAMTGKMVLIEDAYNDVRFNRSVDVKTGYRTRSIMCMPIELQGKIVAVAQLINKLDKNGKVIPFGDEDVMIFSSFAAFAATFIRNSRLVKYAQTQAQKSSFMLHLANRLSLGSLDPELPMKILECSRTVSRADKATLLIVDKKHEIFDAHLDDGTTLEMPLDACIAGHVCRTREVINVEDVYTHPSFSAYLDKKTDYRTRSFLSTPIMFEDEVVAVAQLVNKKNEDDEVVPFTESDMEWMEIFGISVGAAIQNARLHHRLTKEKLQNDTMVEVISSLSSLDLADDTTSVIARVQEGAMELLQAEGCTVYRMERRSNTLQVVQTGKSGVSTKTLELELGQGIAGYVAKHGEIVNIPDAYEDQRFDQEVDGQNGTVTQSILSIPIRKGQDILGVIEVMNKKGRGPFDESDEDLLASFARLAGIHLGNNQLYQFTVQSHEEMLAVLNISNMSRRSSLPSMPVDRELDALSSTVGPGSDLRALTGALRALMTTDNRLDRDLKNILCTTSWDVHDMAAKDRVQDTMIILAHLFEDLGVMHHFNIHRNVLYNFMLRTQAKYRKVHYHNFWHAVDVTQTIYVLIKILDPVMKFSLLEKLVLLATGLVHDVDHMGLNNSFHLKADTPMGILSSASGTASVLEVHHCNVAIAILSNEDSNIFATLPKDDVSKAYAMMVTTILGTDMAKHAVHHAEIKDHMSKLKEGELLGPDMDRELLLKLVVTSADISNVTKPFPIARSWAMLITEEFFTQGDLEKASGLQVTAICDRKANAELAKGQLGFINFVARNHYDLMTKWRPEFGFMLDQLNSNSSTWKLIMHSKSSANLLE